MAKPREGILTAPTHQKMTPTFRKERKCNVAEKMNQVALAWDYAKERRTQIIIIMSAIRGLLI
eukprot:scaffold1170_cov273-Chaetoceros_neogracile.AAC.2